MILECLNCPRSGPHPHGDDGMMFAAHIPFAECMVTHDARGGEHDKSINHDRDFPELPRKKEK